VLSVTTAHDTSDVDCPEMVRDGLALLVEGEYVFL